MFARDVSGTDITPYLIDEVDGVGAATTGISFGANTSIASIQLSLNNSYGSNFVAFPLVNTFSNTAQVQAVRVGPFGATLIPGAVSVPVTGVGDILTCVDTANDRMYTICHDAGTDDEYKLIACDLVNNSIAQVGSTFTGAADGGGTNFFVVRNMWVDVSGDILCAFGRPDTPGTTSMRAFRFNGATFSLVHSLDISANPSGTGFPVLNFADCFTVRDSADPDFKINVYTYSSSTGFAFDFTYDPAALFSGTKTGCQLYRDQLTGTLTIAPENNSLPADDFYFRTIVPSTNSLTSLGSIINAANPNIVGEHRLGNRVIWRPSGATTRRIAAYDGASTLTDLPDRYTAGDAFLTLHPVLNGGYNFQTWDRNFNTALADLQFTYVADDTVLAVAGAGSYASGRATRACSGKCYFSAAIRHTDSGSVVGVGVADATVNLTNTSNYPGIDNKSLAVGSPNGTTFFNGASLGTVGTLSAPDQVEIAVDTATRKVWVRQEGGAWLGGGDPAAGTSPTATLSGTGDIYPAYWVSDTGSLVNRFTTLNTELSGTTGTVPSGFTAANWK
jgi:hypothetical protein